jgi:hypothetical protein
MTPNTGTRHSKAAQHVSCVEVRCQPKIVESWLMTLRQYLDAQGRRSKWITVAVFIPCCGVVWAFGSRYVWIGPALFTWFAAVMHVFATAIPCPRCRAPLGRVGYRYFFAISSRAHICSTERAEYLGKCPNCALHLDEQIRSSLYHSRRVRPA